MGINIKGNDTYDLEEQYTSDKASRLRAQNKDLLDKVPFSENDDLPKISKQEMWTKDEICKKFLEFPIITHASDKGKGYHSTTIYLKIPRSWSGFTNYLKEKFDFRTTSDCHRAIYYLGIRTMLLNLKAIDNKLPDRDIWVELLLKSILEKKDRDIRNSMVQILAKNDSIDIEEVEKADPELAETIKAIRKLQEIEG